LGGAENMKYFIQINQIVLSKYKFLDIKEAAILDYLRAWCQADDKKIKQLSIKEEGVEYRYTWINFKHLIQEMPLLRIKDKGAISRRIKKLEKIGFIKTFRAPDMNLYIRLTEKIKELEFDGRKPVCWHCGQKKDEKLSVDINQQTIDTNQHFLLTEINTTNNISIKQNTKNNISSKEGVLTNTPAQNEVSIIRNYFIQKCQELKGFKPEMSFAKEGKLIKEKLKRYSVEQLKDLIDKFLNSEVGEKLGWTLSVCLSAPVINQWLAGKLEKKKRPYWSGFPLRKVFGKWQVLVDGEWKEFAGSEKEIVFK